MDDVMRNREAEKVTTAEGGILASFPCQDLFHFSRFDAFHLKKKKKAFLFTVMAQCASRPLPLKLLLNDHHSPVMVIITL